MQSEKASSAFNNSDVGFSASPLHFSNAAAAETVARGPVPVSFSSCFNALFIHNTPPTNNNATWSSLWGKLMLHLGCVFFRAHFVLQSSTQPSSVSTFCTFLPYCAAFCSQMDALCCHIFVGCYRTVWCESRRDLTGGGGGVRFVRPALRDAGQSHLFPLVSWEFWFYYR